jgi:hypothetical protein
MALRFSIFLWLLLCERSARTPSGTPEGSGDRQPRGA